MKKNQIVRKHSDLMECREASAQHYERKLNALLGNIKKRVPPKPTSEEQFQIDQLTAEVKKWRGESARHAFLSGLKDEFVTEK